MERMREIGQAARVCIVVSFAPSLINFRGPLIRELLRRGHSVTALAPEVDNQTQATLEAMGAELQEIPMSRRGIDPITDVRTMLALTRAFRQISPDIVVSFTVKPNVWSAFAARRAGVRSIACVTGLGYLFSKDEGRSRKIRLVQGVGRLLYRLSTRRNWRVIFQNPDDLSDFVAAGCLTDESKVRLVRGSGVDMEHYAPVPLPRSPVTFLMISRLLGDKGVREYVRAGLSLKKQDPKIRVVLVGYMDPGLDGIDQQEVDEWMSQGLEYLGPMADVRPVLAASNVYVLPSYREGTPRSVLEAMATGRPVVTTDAPGCRETVEDGVNGYLVPVRDVEALALKMTKLAKDAKLRTSMGNAGLARARDLYDVDRVNDAMIDHMGLK